jgi:hypothetical protein
MEEAQEGAMVRQDGNRQERTALRVYNSTVTGQMGGDCGGQGQWIQPTMCIAGTNDDGALGTVGAHGPD